MKPERSPLEEHLFSPVGADSVGPCPDPSVLGRAADGCLDAEERPVLERHLLACDACSGIVATLSGHVALAPRRGARRYLWPALAAAAAAAVLLAVVLANDFGGQRPTAERLTAACRSLDFDALNETELRAGGNNALRGAVRPIAPRGRVLSARPLFRWHQTDGEPVEFLLVDVDLGEILWQETLEAPVGGQVAERGRVMAYPPAQPALRAGASVVWKVGPRGGVDAAEGVMFTVASDSERAEAATTFATIDREVGEDVRDLVAAHFALRRGYLAEAAARATSYCRQHPSEPLGRTTLNLVERRLGLPETSGAKED